MVTIKQEGVAFYQCMLNIQIIELPSPYGDCDASEDYEQSRCFTDCLANYVIKNCSCKDVHMSGESKVYHTLSNNELIGLSQCRLFVF